MTDALVIGAGPAGLMAAEIMAGAGLSVTVAEQKPSVARKFLMAGKSGLNLTRDEDTEISLARYSPCPPLLADAIRSFGPAEVMAWAEGLGQPLFTGSSGRVFPQAMKASPLLRAWMARLSEHGVTLHTRWRWTSWQGDAWTFETADGVRVISADHVVLALGGASWPRLGSDAKWVPQLAEKGVRINAFAPANVGLAMDWSDYMTGHFGAPIKTVEWCAGDLTSRGEAVISARGLEGGGIYPLIPAIRQGHRLYVDLMPDVALERVVKRLPVDGSRGLTKILRNTLRLSPPKIALFQEMMQGCAVPLQGAKLARVIKAVPIRHNGPRPVEEAISSAGGVSWTELGCGFELAAMPRVHLAGEMLDWEAPTGGYLLTACLATGRAAGKAVVAKVAEGRA